MFPTIARYQALQFLEPAIVVRARQSQVVLLAQDECITRWRHLIHFMDPWDSWKMAQGDEGMTKLYSSVPRRSCDGQQW